MPIKKSGNFNLTDNIITVTKRKLSEFLSDEELDQTEIHINNNRIEFKANESITEKIEINFNTPTKHEQHKDE